MLSAVTFYCSSPDFCIMEHLIYLAQVSLCDAVSQQALLSFISACEILKDLYHRTGVSVYMVERYSSSV